MRALCSSPVVARLVGARRPAALVALALGVAAAGCGGPGHARAPSTTAPARPTTSRPLAIRARLAPWRLPAPLSREVVLPDGQDLVILGGLDRTGSSVSGAFCLDPADGAIRQVGTLAEPTHDAGGAVLGGVDVVVGGGAATVYDTVQALRVPAGSCPAPASSPRPSVPVSFASGSSPPPGEATATVVGTLPRPRADVSVAERAGVAYVVGGYDGQQMDPAVLATSNGRTYRRLSRLPRPVRYGAVAIAGRWLWVMGGLAGGGATAAIQRVDVRDGSAQVVGRLPAPTSGATAMVLGGRIVVLGGLVGGHPSRQMVSVDPGTGRARRVGQLPEPVSNAAGAVVGGRGWLVGGEGPQSLATVIQVSAG